MHQFMLQAEAAEAHTQLLAQALRDRQIFKEAQAAAAEDIRQAEAEERVAQEIAELEVYLLFISMVDMETKVVIHQ